MKTKTTNQSVVSRRCKILPYNQAAAQITKKFFVIRLLTILMIALVMSGLTYFQQASVNLGTEGNFTILSKSGISTIPASSIIGDIGVSPIDQTALTGFSLVINPSNVFATSTQVPGKVLLAQTAVTLDINIITKPSDTTGVEAGFISDEFILSQNYPNPFNPSTNIQYNLGKAGMVLLRIYNLLGNEVAKLVNGYQATGSYTVEFNASKTIHNFVSGVYFYRLEIFQNDDKSTLTKLFDSTKKLILLK